MRAISGVYTTPDKVAQFLGVSSFSSSTTPTQETVENLIDRAEEEIDAMTNRTWKKTLTDTEYYDIKQYYTAPQDKNRYIIYLRHKDIISLETLYYFNGSSWDDWATNKTEGRGDDYYLNYKKGILYLYGVYPGRDKVKITYYYGKPQETLSSGITDTDTSLTLSTTDYYPNHGILKIGTEYIRYTGKTATTITGMTRGVHNSTAASHTSGSIVYTINQGIEDLATKLTVYLLATTNRRTAILPEGNTEQTQAEFINNLYKSIKATLETYRDITVV